MLFTHLYETTGHQGQDNLRRLLNAIKNSQDVELIVGNEPVTLTYPEARYLGGQFRAFQKAGKMDEFLRHLVDPVWFDAHMAKLRGMIDRQRALGEMDTNPNDLESDVEREQETQRMTQQDAAAGGMAEDSSEYSGPHGKMNIDRSRKGVTRVTRQGYAQGYVPPGTGDRGRRPGDKSGAGGYAGGGVGAPQKTSFSGVASDSKAGRMMPRLDYDSDDRFTESQGNVQKFNDYDSWRDAIIDQGGNIHEQKNRTLFVATDWSGEELGKFDTRTNQGWAMSPGVAEAGPFSYGAKKPRKGSVTDLAAKKRQEQERGRQPAEPRDHMVGTAKVVKETDTAAHQQKLKALEYIKKQGYGQLINKMPIKDILKLINDEKNDWHKDDNLPEGVAEGFARFQVGDKISFPLSQMATGIVDKIDDKRLYVKLDNGEVYTIPSTMLHSVKLLERQGVAEGADDIAQAKERLAYLEKIFDTSYEYSDDHSVWKKHNAIRQEMDQLKRLIAQGNKNVSEEAKKGLYYNVNKRKKAGTSRPKGHPLAPSAQDWKDAAKTAKNEGVAEEKTRLDPKCWSGKKIGNPKTKMKGGVRVNNCVPAESVEEDWQKANKKDKTDGMSQKAVNAYRRENPGSKLQTAVTTKPSKLKRGSKASKRRSSYCSRSAGQKKMHHIDCSKTPDKAICKARRRWNCEESVMEGRVKEIAIQYQDYKHLPEMAFQSRYKMSKGDWWAKYGKMVQGSGLGIGLNEFAPGDGSDRGIDWTQLVNYVRRTLDSFGFSFEGSQNFAEYSRGNDALTLEYDPSDPAWFGWALGRYAGNFDVLYSGTDPLTLDSADQVLEYVDRVFGFQQRDVSEVRRPTPSAATRLKQNLKRAGYDVDERERYWRERVKKINQEIEQWNAENPEHQIKKRTDENHNAEYHRYERDPKTGRILYRGLQENADYPGSQGDWIHGGFKVRFDPATNTVRVFNRNQERAHRWPKTPTPQAYRLIVQKLIDRLEDESI